MTAGLALRRSIELAALLAAVAVPPGLTVLGVAVLVGLAAAGPGTAADRLLRGTALTALALAGTVIVYAAW
jgi:predicted short-subunit dehydrogenase-like oxidoreductase (DUF2520 family)